MKNYTPVYVYPLTEDDGWKSLTGELRVKMTNDYLFRALLQSDNDTLKALLASLLRIDVSDIRSAEVTNPILLGESIEDKTFIMDVNVELNNDTLIDLEMQVIRESGWTERSLSYICREFDQLNSGMAYIEAKPVRQIAFCDFTLFKDAPEFYATYKLINERNKNKVYSEKLVISNIDLTRPDLATKEDKRYHLDEWCRLFKAKTWEDMRMLAENNAVMGKAISGVWQLTEEERIREKCRAREQWLINDKWKRDKIAELETEIADQKTTIKEYEISDKKKSETISEQKAEITEQKTKISALQKEIEELRNQISQT